MASENRIARMAEALRANLRRRKEQARSRKSAPGDDGSVVVTACAAGASRGADRDESGPDTLGVADADGGGGDGGGGGD